MFHNTHNFPEKIEYIISIFYMSLTIRSGRKDDYQFVIDAVRDVVRIYKGDQEPPPPMPGAEQTYYDMLNDKQHHEVLIAEANGKRVGAALVSFTTAIHFGGWSAEVQDLYVDPTVRKMGIGKALLDRVSKIAEERKLKAIELYQPPPGSEQDEERSLFYKKNGFWAGGFTRHKIISEDLIYDHQ
ncbi:acetyltransferase, GNAT family protein [Tritrichomonas foetus]|uniref:Acetyltransferase, GNAT family protein n=1 Tax=Tritrichomonas foetus TaxID=1144522 RepID=A0A1J4JNL5_9EUKA|nr:acetyltransferase, GNAT family protein [Tritrichomonas foetus]|eukprot:OHT00713.1 acetyltransferase, GNAT family protein [Tritrichomonas foetus]